MASSTAGDAKFSLAISFKLVRWSVSSWRMARPTSGETRATTSSAAAKAIDSGDPAPGPPAGVVVRAVFMGTSLALTSGAKARGRNTTSISGGRLLLRSTQSTWHGDDHRYW